MCVHTKNDIYSIMRTNTALLVHFSACPKMMDMGRNIFFPFDLTYIANTSQPPISCSMVKPDDKYDYTDDKRNVPGHIGLVLDINQPQSIVLAINEDGGTDDDTKQKLIESGSVASLDAITSCITNKNLFNEVVVNGYTVLGLFISPTMYLYVETAKGQQTDIEFNFARSLFPKLYTYTFLGKKIVRCDLLYTELAHEAIYKPT